MPTTTAPRPRRPVEPPLSPDPVRVVCVDPYDLARQGVAYLARRYPDLTMMGEAGSAEAAGAVVARTRPDVVLVGDDLPDGGRGLLAELRAAYPGIGLVVVSHHAHDLCFPRARQAGASAFVSHAAPVTATVAAIRHAAAAPREFRTFGVPWVVERDAEAARRLSERERQVLALMSDGLCAEDIATTLRVGRGTVRTYVSRLYAKLQVSNRSQALLAAAGDGQVGGAGDAPVGGAEGALVAAGRG